MGRILRAGVIGNGGIAKSHNAAYARLIKEAAPVVTAAYCDIRPEQLEGLEGKRTYTDIDEMLEKEKGRMDYVDICLPTYLHSEVAVKAMKAGYDVLCEKPMALNAAQAETMCRMASETGRTLMIAHCVRFMNDTRNIRNYIGSGKFGKVRNADFWREGGSTKPMGYQNWFRKSELSGGAILDLHIHDADLVQWLFGMPEAVSAAAINIIPGGGYDSMSVNYYYSDGKYVHAGCDWTICSDKFNTRAKRVNFENGYIYSDRTAGRGACVAVGAGGDVTDLALEPVMGNDSYYNEIKYFTECLLKGEPVNECLPESSAASVRLVMAEMKSADLKGERIAVN